MVSLMVFHSLNILFILSLLSLIECEGESMALPCLVESRNLSDAFLNGFDIIDNVLLKNRNIKKKNPLQMK